MADVAQGGVVLNVDDLLLVPVRGAVYALTGLHLVAVVVNVGRPLVDHWRRVTAAACKPMVGTCCLHSAAIYPSSLHTSCISPVTS